jgi:hypothetical protein
VKKLGEVAFVFVAIPLAIIGAVVLRTYDELTRLKDTLR